MLRRTPIAAVLLTVLFGSSSAFAGDAALAEALFQEGRAQMDAGNYAVACPKLAESYAQDPATGALAALATCQEQAGQTATAWATYAEVASRAKQEGRADREQAARERVQALGAALSRLTITVDAAASAVPGLAITRDGIAVGHAAWGAAAPVDPGEHLVEVTAPGRKSWKVSVRVGPNADTRTVQVPALENEVAAAADVAPAPPAQAPARDSGPAAPGEPSPGAPVRTIGLVIGGVGLVTLGVSGFFGLRGKSLYADSKKDGHCDANNECDPTGLSKRNDAVSASTAATITLVAGGVLTAAGVTLFLVGGPKEKEAGAARVEATPLVGWNEAAMVVRGRF